MREQQCTRKSNPRTHQKDYLPWSKRLHPRDAKIAQHMKICQCNPPYKQTERKTFIIIALGDEKLFEKIQHPFMIKVSEMSGIQGTHTSIIKAF